MKIHPLDYLDTCFCCIIQYKLPRKKEYHWLIAWECSWAATAWVHLHLLDDVPNDAPNVPVLPGLSPLHMYSMISINPISLCFTHARRHTETHAAYTPCLRVCVCTDLEFLVCVAWADRQKQTLRSGNQLSAHLNQISTGCPGNHSATIAAGSQRFWE